MKKIIFLIFIFSSIISKSQNRYHYKISISDVNDIYTAKESTDWIRNIFNVYPYFNDSTDSFDFYSQIDINKDIFIEKGLQNGYLVVGFIKSPAIISNFKEEEE